MLSRHLRDRADSIPNRDLLDDQPESVSTRFGPGCNQIPNLACLFIRWCPDPLAEATNPFFFLTMGDMRIRTFSLVPCNIGPMQGGGGYPTFAKLQLPSGSRPPQLITSRSPAVLQSTGNSRKGCHSHPGLLEIQRDAKYDLAYKKWQAFFKESSAFTLHY